MAAPISGYARFNPTTQAMQDDEFGNPAMVTVDRGAEPFQTGSAEYQLLELPLMTRARGLPIETPVVRC